MSSEQTPKANVLGISIDAVNMSGALDRIACELEAERKGYVCLAGVHGVMEAQRHHDLAKIYAESSLVAPDGMPTVWMGRHQGHTAMERVAGPDLMLEVMQYDRLREATHFLCGGKEGIAQELQAKLTDRFPHIRIVGTYTPPFEPMSAEEEKGFVTMVNKLHPDIVWVGISTPKQERFMAKYLPLLDVKLMFGVGAAFDFHTGRIRDCADWVKQSGLQWLHRFMQDPKHLWRRYLRNNPAFIYAIAIQLMRGKREPARKEGEAGSLQSPTASSLAESQLQ